MERADTEPLLEAVGPVGRRRRGQSPRLPILRSYCFSRYPGLRVSSKTARLHARLVDEDDPLRSSAALPTLNRCLTGAPSSGCSSAWMRFLSWSGSCSASFLACGGPALESDCHLWQRKGQRFGFLLPGRRKEWRYGLDRFMRDFKDDEAVEQWFVQNRWPDGIRCPKCGSGRIAERPNQVPQPWRCADCWKYFSVKVGTQCTVPTSRFVSGLRPYTWRPACQGHVCLRDLGLSGSRPGYCLHLLHRIREALSWSLRSSRVQSRSTRTMSAIGEEQAL